MDGSCPQFPWLGAAVDSKWSPPAIWCGIGAQSGVKFMATMRYDEGICLALPATCLAFASHSLALGFAERCLALSYAKLCAAMCGSLENKANPRTGIIFTTQLRQGIPVGRSVRLCSAFPADWSRGANWSRKSARATAQFKTLARIPCTPRRCQTSSCSRLLAFLGCGAALEEVRTDSRQAATTERGSVISGGKDGASRAYNHLRFIDDEGAHY